MKKLTKNEEQFELDSEIELYRSGNKLNFNEDIKEYAFTISNVCDYLSRNPEITDLCISHINLDDKDASSLAIAIQNLKQLTFDYVNMSDKGMRLLALTSSMANLHFSFCKITDQQALYLAGKSSMTSLEIEEHELQISETGLQALINSRQLNTFTCWPIQAAVLAVLENKLAFIPPNLKGSCTIGYQNGALTSLILGYNCQFDDYISGLLKDNRTIPDLSLVNYSGITPGITEQGARALASNNVIIHHLNLSYNIIGDMGAAAFKYNNTIIDLKLRRCGIGHPGANRLAENKTITRLNLRGNNIGDQGAAAFRYNQSITELDLTECGITEQGAVELAGTKTIVCLNLTNNTIGNRDAAAFKTNRSITDLNLHRCNIGAQGAIELAKNDVITNLILSRNNIGDEGAAAFKANTSLTTLAISYCNITYQGATELAKNKTITDLDLAFNRIEDAGVAAFIDNTSLTKLRVCDNKISGRGYAALALNQSISTLIQWNVSRQLQSPLAACFLLANRSLLDFFPSSFEHLSHSRSELVKEIKKMPHRNRLFQTEYALKTREAISGCLGIKALTEVVYDYAKGEFPCQYSLFKEPEGRQAVNELREKMPALSKYLDCLL